jgi:hypothetical protein
MFQQKYPYKTLGPSAKENVKGHLEKRRLPTVLDHTRCHKLFLHIIAGRG